MISDQELIQALIQKNNHAYKQVIENYQSLVYKACYNLVKFKEDAEDLAQEVFLELFESIHLFRNESKLSTWLYRISINKSLNHIRKYKWKERVRSIENVFVGEKKSNFEPEDPQALNAPFTLEYKERVNILQSAISQLPENQRIAFTLNKYNELSYQEIAEIMSLSLSSVESLIHRAKLNLQKKLINYYKK